MTRHNSGTTLRPSPFGGCASLRRLTEAQDAEPSGTEGRLYACPHLSPQYSGVTWNRVTPVRSPELEDRWHWAWRTQNGQKTEGTWKRRADRPSGLFCARSSMPRARRGELRRGVTPTRLSVGLPSGQVPGAGGMLAAGCLPVRTALPQASFCTGYRRYTSTARPWPRAVSDVHRKAHNAWSRWRSDTCALTNPWM